MSLEYNLCSFIRLTNYIICYLVLLRLDILGCIISSSRLDMFGYILLLPSCYASTFSNAASISPSAAGFRANTRRNDKEITIE